MHTIEPTRAPEALQRRHSRWGVLVDLIDSEGRWLARENRNPQGRLRHVRLALWQPSADRVAREAADLVPSTSVEVATSKRAARRAARAALVAKFRAGSATSAEIQSTLADLLERR